MNTQLKKGLLEACLLAALRNKDLYGYKMVEELSLHIEISESTLYPILRRLEINDCLTTYSVEHNGRLRKYYKITDKGKETITEFLNSWDRVTKVYNFIKGESEHE